MSAGKTTSKRSQGRSQANRRNRDIYIMGEWSKFVRDRAGRRCERCDQSEDVLKFAGFHLEGAHIEGRAKRSARYLVDNGIALCRGPRGSTAGCHYIFDNKMSAKERLDFAYEVRGSALDGVFRVVNERWDRDLDRALAEIKASRLQWKARHGRTAA